MAARTAPTKTGGREATTGVIPGDFALSVGMPETKAPRGWKWTPLTAVARLETGHTPSRNHPEYWDGDIPWIGIKDATGNHGLTIDDTLQHTTQAGIDNSSARVLPAHTVCLSRTASVGYVVVMGRPMATSQDFVNWVCSDALDYRYLKYVLLSERRSFLRFASGTTHQTIYFPEVKAFHVCLPPLPEQRAIAGVLGALDDKIEVNRKTARVLEGIARAVFTSWFVDFDPVRRHSRAPHAAASHPGSAAVRRAPGPAPLPADLAALFPTRLVDSPIGEVPEGWRVGTIDSLCDSITSGGTPARMNKQYWEGGTIPWFKTGELFDAPLFDSEEHITEAALANSSCKLWPAGTILFALYASPTVGRMGVLTRAGTSNQAAAGLTVKPEYGIPFLLNTLFFARAKLQQIAVGAAQQNINQGVLKAHQVVVPAAGLAQRFSQLMTPALEKQAQLSSHSATLAALRDALLPKLISGELRIADAEKIVGMVV